MRLLLVLLVVLLCASCAFAQHLGGRVQWQPQTMAADARLEQLVTIEIIGRAAVPALELLTKATGVSLTVAPEDLSTVGERKLTIIANNLPLRVIMTQLPEALREAHWDIDDSGGEPVYLLHRNTNVEKAAKIDQTKPRIIRAPSEEQRTDRLEDARNALAMSPEEVSNLEETDLFLARTLRHPEARELMQSIFSLSQERLDELCKTNRLRFSYTSAPQELRQAAKIALSLQRQWAEWGLNWPADLAPPEEFDPANTKQAIAALEQDIQNGAEVTLILHFIATQGLSLAIIGPNGSTGHTVIPARPPQLALSGNYCEFLLTQTGDSLVSARKIADDFTAEWSNQQEIEEWAEIKYSWSESNDTRLQARIEWPFDNDKTITLSGAQQVIARHTGLSIIADYFTIETIDCSSTHPDTAGPLWHDLYVLGKLGRFKWKLAGDCLVFYHSDWYQLTQYEMKIKDREF